MTTFAELFDATVVNTKRPELVALTESCVRLATMKAHQTDFFMRDQVIVPLIYAPTNVSPFVDIANVSTQLPRKRSITLVQSVDLSTLHPVENFEWREYKDFWDRDRELRTSVYTEIGDTLRLRPCVQTGRFDVMYYLNPVTSPAADYASWIADAHVEEVAMWAAGLVWARTGFLEQARVAQELHITPFKDLLVSSYLIGTVN
jgi:hypothetical protein